MESQHPPTPKTPTAWNPPTPLWIPMWLVIGGTGIFWVFFPHFTDHTIIHPFAEFLHSLSSLP